MKKISIEQIENEIAQQLKTYTKDVEEGLEREKQKAARAGAKELRESPLTPVRKYGARKGQYKKGWTSTKRGTSYVIRNRTDPSLTHLLEKGHALRQGGRAKAYPHIKPVEEKVIKAYYDGTVKVIQGS